MATATVQPTTEMPGIVRDPAILGGEPTIAGTRVPVWAVVVMSALHRGDHECVRRSLPTLTGEDIARALAYYATNRAEIDRYMKKNGVDPASRCDK